VIGTHLDPESVDVEVRVAAYQRIEGP
jgi:hypothetical protein